MWVWVVGSLLDKQMYCPSCIRCVLAASVSAKGSISAALTGRQAGRPRKRPQILAGVCWTDGRPEKSVIMTASRGRNEGLDNDRLLVVPRAYLFCPLWSKHCENPPMSSW